MRLRIYGIFIVCFLVVAACAALPAFAAGTATLGGTIVNGSSGAAIAGAKVSLTGNGQTLTTASGPNGAFAFHDLAAGTWDLRTTALQYERNDSGAIVLAAGQTLNVVVAMQPVTTTNITTLGRVSVVGQRTLNTSSAAVTTVTANEYVNAGAPQIQTLLETTPGLAIEHYDNGAPGNVSTFTIRGAGGFGSGTDGGGNTGYEVLVLQDGEPIRNGQYGDADLSGLTPAIYSRVEVVKGVGGTSLFGANTIGGTLNLVTIDPRPTTGAELIGSVGGFGTTDYNVSQTDTIGRFGYVLDYHHYGTDGYIQSNLLVDNPPTTFVSSGNTGPVGVITHPSQAMGLRSGLGKIRYNFSDNTYGVLTVTDEADWRDQSGLISNPETVFLAGPGVTLSKDPLGYPYFFVFPMNFVWNTDPKYAFDLHTALAGGSLVARYYDNWINRWVDGNSAPSFDCCFLQKSIDHLAGELLTWEKPFGNQNITLAVGGNGDNFQYGSQFNFEKPVTASQITPTTGSQIERTVLLRDDDDISAKFRATFAGYYSDYNDLNVKRFDPRFAVVNRPDENTAIRFSVGTGFAPPRLSDIVSPLDLSVFTSTTGPNCTSSNFFCNATSGNPNIKPETGTGYDLGFERTFGAQGDLSIDLYRTDLKSHIFYGILPAPPGLLFSDGVTPVLGIQEPINLAGSVYTGIEASGALPVTRFFTAHAYYNTQASYPTGVDLMTEQTLGDVVNNQQYLGVPLHKIGWSMSFQNGANLTAFFGADWFGPNNSYNVPQFWQYNAGASVPYGPDTSLHVAWRNIFNKNATIFETFGGGVPYPSIAGFGGCTSACTYTTSAYSSPPHTLTVTIDHRWGSLR